METKDIRIVQLEPLRVARFHGFGAGPEMEAWQKLVDWAGPRGLMDYTDAHRIFGFNNPNPSPGSPNYGYEYWITVTPEETAGEKVDIVNFPGGLYAVAKCLVRDPGNDIPETWQQLVAWRESSPYKAANHQWMEQHLRVGTPGSDFDLDIYLPVAK